ncbi:MAG TPA: TSUP family transporter [Casimicrobiaceae bacterium]
MTGGRVVGTFGGLWMLTAFTASALSIFIGVATIAAAAATFVIPSFQPGRRSLIGAGVITGITETATGIGGPPLALVFQHRTAAVLRCTIAFCFLVGELISLALLGVAGRASTFQFTMPALLLPALALGAALSRYAHQRFNCRVLRVFVLVFAVASGAVLIVRA